MGSDSDENRFNDAGLEEVSPRILETRDSTSPFRNKQENMANCLSILVEEKEEDDHDDSLDRSKRKYTDSGDLPQFAAANPQNDPVHQKAIVVEEVKDDLSSPTTLPS